MIVTCHKSIIEDVPEKTYFDSKIVKNFIKCSGNLETFNILIDDIRVGYAIMKYEESVYSLEIFEIFDPYKGYGYGTKFIHYIKDVPIF